MIQFYTERVGVGGVNYEEFVYHWKIWGLRGRIPKPDKRKGLEESFFKKNSRIQEYTKLTCNGRRK